LDSKRSSWYRYHAGDELKKNEGEGMSLQCTPKRKGKLSCPVENVGNIYVRSYMGNSMGNDWFSQNVTLASRVSGVWRKRKEEGELPSKCSDRKRPTYVRSPPGAGRTVGSVMRLNPRSAISESRPERA